MVMERASSKRSWLSDKEMDEFDHITADQIRGMRDLRKLQKLERYMREEGFSQTAEAAGEAIVNLGGRVHRSEDRQGFDEQDEEFDSFLKSFDSWKDSIKHADDKLRELRREKTGDVLDCKPQTPSTTDLPSIRKACIASPRNNSVSEKSTTKKKDEEETKMEPAEKQTEKFNTVNKEERNTLKSKSRTEREWFAEREREKGNELYKAQEYTASLQAYNKSIDLFHGSSTSYSNRAAVYIKMNRWEEAHADCSEALKLDPGYTKALMRRGLVSLETMKPREALEDLDAALKLDPSNSEVLSLKQKAERQIAKMNDKKPEVKKSKRISIEEVEGTGEKEKRHKTCDTLLGLEDETADDKPLKLKQEIDNRRKVLIEEIDTTTRIEEPSDHASKDAKYVPMRVGPMLIEEVNEDLKEEELKETHDLKPSSNESTFKKTNSETSELHNHVLDHAEEEAERESLKGNDEFKRGNRSAAMECYNKSISLDSEVAATYSNRALCYLKEKNWEAAKKDCTEALKVDGGYVKALYRRALALEGLGELRGALKDIQAALKMEPDDKDLLDKLRKIKRKLRVAFVKEVTKEEAESRKRLDEASKAWPVITENQQPRPVVKREHPFESWEEDKLEQSAPSKNFKFSKANGASSKPKTTMEFQRTCEKLQNQPDILRKFIKNIAADEYPGIFKESLSAEALRILIKSLHAVFVPYDPKGAMAVLGGLAKVKRFGLILKLLPPCEKKSFLSLFDWLHHCCNEPIDRTDEGLIHVIPRKCI